MNSNVISFDERRRARQVQEDLENDRSRDGTSPGNLLSLNLANWLASNFSNLEGTRGLDPDLEAALYFARGRVYYYRNDMTSSARAFSIVSSTAEGRDLRTLSDLGYANILFSDGEFERAHAALRSMDPEGLPEALQKCLQILEANILFAKGQDLEEASTIYRKALCETSRSLWIRNLQVNVAAAIPPSHELMSGKGLTRLRDILDAFIEMAASRYFASLVVTLG